MGTLEEGMDIHQRVVENGFTLNDVVINGLIGMYEKCGNLEEYTRPKNYLTRCMIHS